MACAGHAAQRSQQRHDQPKRHANADAVAGEPGWKAVYARCRLALMKLQRLDTVDNPADPVPLRCASGESLICMPYFLAWIAVADAICCVGAAVWLPEVTI